MAFVRVMLVFWLITFDGAVGDPCNQYKYIREPVRSVNFHPSSNDQYICDNLLAPGWYRSLDSNGRPNKMPTQCIPVNSCGTEVPIWLKGNHPPNDGQIHSMTACHNYDIPGNCCEDPFQIEVKNCNDQFFVYNLKPTSGCNMAYCFGSEYTCPVGSFGRNNSCLKLSPHLTSPPTLGIPVLKSGLEVFPCHVNYHGEPNVAFNVSWEIDGTVLAQQTLIGQDRTAYFQARYLRNHMNKNLKCVVTGWFTNTTTTAQKSSPVESNSYYCGLQVDTDHIEVDEKGSSKQITITSTVPISCRNPSPCQFQLQLFTNRSNNDMCASKCVYDMVKGADGLWRTTVTVKASRDFLDEHKDNIHQLDFHVLTVPLGNEEFRQLKAPPITVVTKNSPTGHCNCGADPHCHMFNGQYMDLYTKPGAYVMFRSKSRNAEVHITVFDCVGIARHPCICAVAAKEDGEWRSIDVCRRRNSVSTAPVLQSLGQLNPSWGMFVNNKTGKAYKITFPSGMHLYVTVVSGRRGQYMNVALDVPSDDKDHSDGVCGFLSDYINDTFKAVDGSIHPPVNHQSPVFATSWMIPGNASLFNLNNIHQTVTTQPYISYCGCDNGVASCTKGSCSSNPKNTILSNFKPITGTVHHHNGRKRDYLMSDHPELSMNSVFELIEEASNDEPEKLRRNIVPEHQALAFCSTSIRKSSLFAQHSSVVDQETIDNVIHGCVEDYKVSRDESFFTSAMDTFNDICSSIILKNISSYTVRPDGQLTPPHTLTEWLEDMCPNQCSLRGSCSNGTCVCHGGYGGPDCSVPPNSPAHPVINRIRGDGICDIRQRPCQSVFIIVDNLDFSSTHHKCKIAYSDKNHQPNEVVVDAIAISAWEVVCPLNPKSLLQGHSSVSVNISVTQDAITYSAAASFLVFDSLCMNCSQPDRQCTLKPSTCLIDGKCYEAGNIQGDLSYNLKVCNPFVSQTTWTPVADSNVFAGYTVSMEGCPCLFRKGDTSSACACCQEGGCQCGPRHPHQCVFCEHTRACNFITMIKPTKMP